ncbi:hypothetical protein E8E12_008234 [Didymella heteroderae]|uniref:1-alkyl-2-acetylglycerophosphocholine esterase n=1 Tax=Didymella heteroderae TaxID=1769908 RepID=A0A9P4WNX3_9PLEO|nr:hypothetical protein E8E12_008234 [Didymella heteroderae]
MASFVPPESVPLPMMLILLTTLTVQTVAATPFPRPTGPFHVGYTQYVFDISTQDDPFASANLSLTLLATIYCPTLTRPVPGENTAPYLDPTTAQIWVTNWQIPNGSLGSLTTWNVHQAPPFEAASNDASQKPTVIFSPGAGENAIMYNTLSSKLASQGYTVVALDHAGEVPYLQLPNGAPGIYGIDIKAEWNVTFAEAVYHIRVADIIATVKDLFPVYVESTGAPFDTTHYFAVGHSLGGAAAAGAMSLEPSILGGINFDGTFFGIPDVKKPFLLLGQEAHTPDVPEPTWPWFAGNQTGWFQWLNVAGSNHQNFADLDDWLDLLDLRNETAPLSVGTIWAPRKDCVISMLVETFFNFVMGKQEWIEIPSAAFPEVVYITGGNDAS